MEFRNSLSQNGRAPTWRPLTERETSLVRTIVPDKQKPEPSPRTKCGDVILFKNVSHFLFSVFLTFFLPPRNFWRWRKIEVRNRSYDSICLSFKLSFGSASFGKVTTSTLFKQDSPRVAESIPSPEKLRLSYLKIKMVGIIGIRLFPFWGLAYFQGLC